MTFEEECAWRMSDKHIRTAMERKEMTRRAMASMAKIEKARQSARRKVVALVLIGAMVGGGCAGMCALHARAEEARLRKSGALVDRIFVYDMDGNLIQE